MKFPSRLFKEILLLTEVLLALKEPLTLLPFPTQTFSIISPLNMAVPSPLLLKVIISL